MDGALEIKYDTLIFLACVTVAVLGLLYLATSKQTSCQTCINLSWKSMGSGFYSLISAVFTLGSYAIATVLSIYDLLYLCYLHLHIAWYFLAAFTIIPICVNISTSMSIPFLALYCVTAVVICCRLPSTPVKSTSKKAESQFFMGMRIIIQ